MARGRPSGSFDKSRDYNKAVAKMRALVANGASDREAAKVVGKEEGIPPSTLRKHLAKPLKNEVAELDVSGLEVRTKRRVEEAVPSEKKRKDQGLFTHRPLFRGSLYLDDPPTPRPKKKPK